MLQGMSLRLLQGMAMLALVSILAFGLSVLSPRTPEVHRLGPEAPESAVAALRADLGLDKPLVWQFTSWAGAALTGDLGRSYVTDQPVATEILERAPRTLSLVGASMLLACLLGLGMGALAAMFPSSWLDRSIQVLSSLFQATPGFWLGILLVTVFSLSLGWLPATGYVSPDQSVTGWLASILLPSLALGLPSTAAICRQLRSALIGQLGEEYARTALAQGFHRVYVTLRHALRNAMGPAITIIGFQAVVKLSTIVVIERVFAIEGLGVLALDAVFRGDTPVLLGCVMTFALIVIVINACVDMAYGWVNPRRRTAA